MTIEQILEEISNLSKVHQSMIHQMLTDKILEHSRLNGGIKAVTVGDINAARARWLYDTSAK